jgi:hypothetical protein
MRKTLFEADSTTKKVKVLGVELTVDLSKVKILINGVELSDLKIDDLKIIEE